MWRRLHVLSAVQSFLVATVSAAGVALPLGLRSVAHDDRALLRDLFWPHQLDPFIAFICVFFGVLLTLLGYYHLGRLGLLLNVAAGAVVTWLMAVFAILCFVALGHYSDSFAVSVMAYSAGVVLLYVIIGWVHFRASTAITIRDAQQKLRLLPPQLS